MGRDRYLIAQDHKGQWYIRFRLQKCEGEANNKYCWQMFETNKVVMGPFGSLHHAADHLEAFKAYRETKNDN